MVAQTETIQIRLVNENVGFPIGDPVDPGGYIPESNDAGLNQIFITHNATTYYPGGDGHPNASFVGRIHMVDCDSCDVVQFAQDLNAYGSVVELASVSPEPGVFADVVIYVLVDATIGNTTGSNGNGNVVTTSTVLNQIFDAYNVYQANRDFPDSTDSYFMRLYTAACNCNAGQLKQAMDDEPLIIELTEFYGVAILDVEISEIDDLKIYPNPLGERLFIETTEHLVVFRLLNTLGQEVAVATSKDALNQQLTSIEAGVYLLELLSDTQKKAVYRLLKQ
jgi:hypothetical protein